jgi:hypothetical protein
MFEQKFLAYLLYITLVEIRTQAAEKGDNRLYWLSDLLHNVPFSLLDSDLSKEQYKEIIDRVAALKIDNWLETRKKEFCERYPEYLPE